MRNLSRNKILFKYFLKTRLIFRMPKITLQINSWNKLARFLPRHLPPKHAGLIVVIKSRRRYQPKNIHTAGGFPYHSLFLRNYSATKYGTSCKTVASCSRGWDEPWHSYTSSVFILIEFLNLLFLVRLKIALPSSWAPRHSPSATVLPTVGPRLWI